MKLEQSFSVDAPLERVWETLVDVERVAPCLPGAEITEASEDGIYRGSFTVKLGPTTAAYRGELKMEEADQAAHRAVMRASGQDKRGQGSAKATIVSVMRAEGARTKVEVETDFTITGRLARFGRGGMIKDVSNRLLKDFAECLQRSIETAEAASASPSQSTASAEHAAAGAAGPGAATGAGVGAAEGRSARPSGTGPARAPAKPLSGLSLLFRTLLDRLRRLLGRGG
jgi:carbon monoxide dehydrogenase subunit G